MKKEAENQNERKILSEKLELEELSNRTISSFRLSEELVKDKLEDVGIIEAEEKKDEEKNINKNILKEVARVVIQLAERLEDQEQQAKIRKKFDELLQRDKFPDLEGILDDMFKEIIGTKSKVAKVLKVIHQNIIFTAIFQLKSKVPMTTMTRDVRSREGWRITVCFTNNVVMVSHKRREQSLATAPPEEAYWFGWELRMLFDAELTELESAFLKITDLQFGEKNFFKKERRNQDSTWRW